VSFKILTFIPVNLGTYSPIACWSSGIFLTRISATIRSGELSAATIRLCRNTWNKTGSQLAYKKSRGKRFGRNRKLFLVMGEEINTHTAAKRLLKYFALLSNLLQPLRYRYLGTCYAYQAVFRIRIGSGFNQVSWSGSGFKIRIQEGQHDPQKQKKVQKFHVLKCLMFWELKATPVAWTSFMKA